MVLRLDLGQISFNLVKNAFATRQLALLATRIMFYDILAQACVEIKILIGSQHYKRLRRRITIEFHSLSHFTLTTIVTSCAVT